MFKIKDSGLTFKHGGRLATPKWIVVHYTGVANASAQECAKSVSRGKRNNSTHFIVDEKEIISCVPESLIAWHVGDGKCAQPDKKNPKALSALAGTYASDWRYDLAAKNHMKWIEAGADFKGNREAIGVDLCVKKHNTKTREATDCDWYFDDETVRKGAELVASLCGKHRIPLERVIRHADATGKPCPRPFVALPNDNTTFSDDVWEFFKRLVEQVLKGMKED